MRVYLTNRGALVYGDGTRWKLVRSPKHGRYWKVPCWKTKNGLWHGWVWLDLLTEVHY